MSECEHGKSPGHCPRCMPLRELAEWASDGPYRVELGEYGYEVWSELEVLPYDYKDSLFMAACTPERIISLLDELEEAKAEIKRLKLGQMGSDRKILDNLSEQGIDLERLERVFTSGDNWGQMINAFEYLMVCGTVLAVMREERETDE